MDFIRSNIVLIGLAIVSICCIYLLYLNFSKMREINELRSQINDLKLLINSNNSKNDAIMRHIVLGAQDHPNMSSSVQNNEGSDVASVVSGGGGDTGSMTGNAGSIVGSGGSGSENGVNGIVNSDGGSGGRVVESNEDPYGLDEIDDIESINGAETASVGDIIEHIAANLRNESRDINVGPIPDVDDDELDLDLEEIDTSDSGSGNQKTNTPVPVELTEEDINTIDTLSSTPPSGDNIKSVQVQKSTMSADEMDKKYTKRQLVGLCETYELSSIGNKQQLIERLLAHNKNLI